MKQGPAMNKIAIYGLQAAMGLVAIAAGGAKLAGADVMVDAFGMLGLGASFRLTVGLVEVLAGLCLLMPRAGVLGAALLAVVVVGTAGVTIGQVAGKVMNHGSEVGVVRTHQAVGYAGEFKFQRPAAVSYKDGINI
jgi:uncharacterized membrane protein YphA (DoxX/SURF4 family)